MDVVDQIRVIGDNEDEADKEREYKNFVADLRPAAKVLAKKVA